LDQLDAIGREQCNPVAGTSAGFSKARGDAAGNSVEFTEFPASIGKPNSRFFRPALVGIAQKRNKRHRQFSMFF
jgi:hypothetical protein